MTEPTTDIVVAAALPIAEAPSLWRRFRRSRIGMLGLSIAGVLYLSALGADFFAPYSVDRQFVRSVHVPPQLPSIHDAEGFHRPFVHPWVLTMSPDGLERSYRLDTSRRLPLKMFVRGDAYSLFGLGSARLRLIGAEGGEWFPLGTDGMGRDLLSRLLQGGRVSLTVGLLGVCLSMILGTLIGTVSGFYGGWIDGLIQRFVELLMVFPAIPLWMALAAALPPTWGQVEVYFAIVTILSLVGWGGLARQVRGMVLSLRERDYVRATRAFGASDFYIIRKLMIPGCYHHLIVIAALSVPGMILGETALSFLGLGIRPPMTSWGVLLEEAQHVRVLIEYPWLLLPAVPVLLAVVAFNCIGDGVRDALDRKD